MVLNFCKSLKVTVWLEVHHHKIDQVVHRDVKPANFLFNPRTGEGRLIDFGLSELNRKHDSKDGGDSRQCRCINMTRVCSVCLSKPKQQVDRGGTAGFRAPEILMKYPKYGRFSQILSKYKVIFQMVKLTSLLLEFACYRYSLVDIHISRSQMTSMRYH